MSCFAVVASTRDVEPGGFCRLPNYTKGEHIIAFDASGIGSLTKPAELKCEGVFVVAPSCLSSVASTLKDKEITGIFIHTSIGNRPKKSDIHGVLARFCGSIASEDMDLIKRKSVAFTNMGDEEYRVPGLRSIWEWLMDSPRKVGGPPNDLDMAKLRVDYERFWRRDNVDLLVELVIKLQGTLSDDVVNATREEWRSDFLDCVNDGEAKWMMEEATLGSATKALLSALNANEKSELKTASDNFLSMVRKFMSEVTGGQDSGA